MRLYEFENKVKPEVYIDMDGVLVDFFDAWAKLMGEKSFRDIKDIDKGLQAIRDEDDFWLKLKPTPNAGKLLALVRELKGSYTILSSPLADDPRSEPHKRMWVEKNLKQFPPKKVIITGNKAKYAQQSDGTPNILIDDFGQNIQKWEAAGGIGVKHKDHKFERTFKSLMNHLKKDEKTTEAWSEKYKRSINCNNPKGFSQKAHCAGRKKNESLEENKINFTMPNFDFEWEEANRYEQYRVLGKEKWIQLAKTGKVVVVNNRMANDIENTDAGEEYRDGHWDGLVQAKRDRFTKALSSGQIELPIIARYSDGQLELISGNTRLTGMMRELGQAKAWVYDVPDEVADLEENFADGKKKGKSRPGRVKRAGASCNGSVTSLRKKAKNASGERAKMYHWCANMKSGRNK